MTFRRRWTNAFAAALLAASTAGLACDRGAGGVGDEDAGGSIDQPSLEAETREPGRNSGRAPGAQAVREEPEEPAVDPQALPQPRRVTPGSEIEGKISDPDTLGTDELEFETDWYTLQGHAGETVEISLEPGTGSRLRPMVTVLLPDPNRPDEWRELDARKSRTSGNGVTFEVTFEEAGTKLITVDDARNLPSIDDEQPPESYHGGPGYTYTLTLELQSETAGDRAARGPIEAAPGNAP